MHINTEELIDIKAVIKRLDRTSATIYSMIKRGNFPTGVKVGNSRLWPQAEVETWIAENRKEAN